MQSSFWRNTQNYNCWVVLYLHVQVVLFCFFLFFSICFLEWLCNLQFYVISSNLSSVLHILSINQYCHHFLCIHSNECIVISHIGFQFSSVAQLCPTLCDPMNCSTPGLSIHHQLPEFTQTHVLVGDAIQPSHPLSFPSPPVPNPSQHQSLFQ